MWYDVAGATRATQKCHSIPAASNGPQDTHLVTLPLRLDRLHGGLVCQAYLANMLAAYGADELLGYRYRFSSYSEERTALDWMSGRVARELRVGLLVNPRWAPLRSRTRDRLAADFELVEQEHWGEVRLLVYEQAPR